MNKLWVLVEVRSGIPTNVFVFDNLQSALLSEQELRKNINLENDETGIFCIDQISSRMEIVDEHSA